MILDRVEIINFRLIKNITITFENKDLILIGKNYGGIKYTKSNCSFVLRIQS